MGRKLLNSRALVECIPAVLRWYPGGLTLRQLLKAMRKRNLIFADHSIAVALTELKHRGGVTWSDGIWKRAKVNEVVRENQRDGAVSEVEDTGRQV